jgi:small subunit ribosomal protein S12
MGLYGARKLRKNRKKFRMKDKHYKYRVTGHSKKVDPLEGAPQAKAIVLKKRGVEQKQPHSGIIKCVRVQILKNKKEVTAHVPRNNAINFVDEHDIVTIEGLGGSQKGAVGSMWGVKFRVFKVNDVSLEEIRTGKKQKPTK